MSVPAKNTTWGTIQYKGNEYGVLQTGLSDELAKKITNLERESRLLPYTSAPWMHKIDWCIEDGKLYLTKLYSEEFHKIVFGNTARVFADWVNEMKLLVHHKLICKTYEQRGSYLNEMETLILSFDKGVFLEEQKETELYRSIELKNYIDQYNGYATLRIDSIDLLNYLRDDKKPEYDETFPLILRFVDQMIQQGSKDDISLDIEDVKSVLKEGDIAVFASAKGDDIEEMVGSLVSSITDEILKAKGCLVQLIMYKDYPLRDIEKIVNCFESVLKMDNNTLFILGIKTNNIQEENCVIIKIMISI